MALPGPLLTDLAALLGPRLSTTAADRALHAQSESYMTAGQPDAVVYPNSTAEVAQIAILCAQHGVPMVAWGAALRSKGMRWRSRAGSLSISAT